jgi:hypothetical protein
LLASSVPTKPVDRFLGLKFGPAWPLIIGFLDLRAELFEHRVTRPTGLLGNRIAIQRLEVVEGLDLLARLPVLPDQIFYEFLPPRSL